MATGNDKPVQHSEISPRRPGFGIRHPALLALLGRLKPDAAEDIVWPSGMRLRVEAYAHPAALPDDLVTSVRCIVTVEARILVVQAPEEQHVWAGGRREAGESYADTACREVHEETGWIIRPDDLHQLGFLHYLMYDEQPDDHPYPHPDFLQIVYTAPAYRQDGDGGAWHDLDGWELGSRLVTREELASIPLGASSRPFLAALSDE